MLALGSDFVIENLQFAFIDKQLVFYVEFRLLHLILKYNGVLNGIGVSGYQRYAAVLLSFRQNSPKVFNHKPRLKM